MGAEREGLRHVGGLGGAVDGRPLESLPAEAPVIHPGRAPGLWRGSYQHV